MIVAHDPGHGRPGGDRANLGTMSLGIPERDWVLQLSRDIGSAVPWATHLLMRDSANGVDYDRRAQVAAAKGCSLALCHHVNAHNDPDIDGLMTFVAPGDHIGREVGEAIMRAAPAELRRRKTKAITSGPGNWTRDAWSVLRHYHALGIPVVLIEWGFGTSPIDREILLSIASRSALCAAAGAGIARAMELTHPAGPAQ